MHEPHALGGIQDLESLLDPHVDREVAVVDVDGFLVSALKCSLTAAKNFVDTSKHYDIQAGNLPEKKAFRHSYPRADSAVGDGRCGRPNAAVAVDEDHRHDARL
jgi:hypothetical protein